MNAKQTAWVRFTWDLARLDLHLSAPGGYRFSSAVAADEDEVLQVVLSAYASDPTWRPMMDGIAQRLTERILTTFGERDADYLITKDGERIVGVSGVAKSHWTDQHLLTGVCILPAHQRRGIGTHLLGLSLRRLREMGVESARVYTKARSLAERKIYPKFGSVREEGVIYPATTQN